jgi:CRP/FNR family transcriptional regulator
MIDDLVRRMKNEIPMRAGLDETWFPFLARLTPAGRRELVALVATRVGVGERLLERGDAAGGAYFVVGGSLRVYYITAEGREATLYHVEPGGTCVLALTATFNEEPYPAWVEAGQGGAAFVRVPGAVFHRLLDVEPELRRFVFTVLSGRVFELMRSLEEAGSAQVEQRVARYLLRRREPDGFVRVSQVGIASELGTAREVVFRALRSLSEQGLVETGRMRIRLIDVARLNEVAENAAK